jgi:hypothetical protein
MNQVHAETRQDSVAQTTIVHKLLPSFSREVSFVQSNHTSPSDMSSDSKLLLLPSPAPNIEKANHTSSSDIFSSDSKSLLLPSPAPNIVQSNHTSPSDMSSDSKLLLLPSPAPNIVQSDDPSSSSDLSSDSKLLPSHATDPSYFSGTLFLSTSPFSRWTPSFLLGNTGRTHCSTSLICFHTMQQICYKDY